MREKGGGGVTLEKSGEGNIIAKGFSFPLLFSTKSPLSAFAGLAHEERRGKEARTLMAYQCPREFIVRPWKEKGPGKGKYKGEGMLHGGAVDEG